RALPGLFAPLTFGFPQGPGDGAGGAGTRGGRLLLFRQGGRLKRAPVLVPSGMGDTRVHSPGTWVSTGRGTPVSTGGSGARVDGSNGENRLFSPPGRAAKRRPGAPARSRDEATHPGRAPRSD